MSGRSSSVSRKSSSWSMTSSGRPHRLHCGAFPRLRYRRGRDCPWKKRARCGGAVPKRIQGQRSGGDRLGYPAAPGRIETPATSRAAEDLPLAAGGAWDEGSAAPGTRRGLGHVAGHSSSTRSAGGSSPSARRPAVASLRQRSPKAMRQSNLSRCTRLPSARSSAPSPPIGAPHPAH
jgi:hypothetical protein